MQLTSLISDYVPQDSMFSTAFGNMVKGMPQSSQVLLVTVFSGLGMTLRDAARNGPPKFSGILEVRGKSSNKLTIRGKVVATVIIVGKLLKD